MFLAGHDTNVSIFVDLTTAIDYVISLGYGTPLELPVTLVRNSTGCWINFTVLVKLLLAGRTNAGGKSISPPLILLINAP